MCITLLIALTQTVQMTRPYRIKLCSISDTRLVAIIVINGQLKYIKLCCCCCCYCLLLFVVIVAVVVVVVVFFVCLFVCLFFTRQIWTYRNIEFFS